MSRIQQASAAAQAGRRESNLLQETTLPPRSLLYSLVPCEIGSIFRESLTGYINRLGWTHHVSPRALITEVIFPRLDEQLRLSVSRLSVFCSQGAMSLNTRGGPGQSWISILEQLTAQPQLHVLTLPWWIGGLPFRRQLRAVPAWCPLCLSE